MEKQEKLLKKLNLQPSKLQETLKNPNLTKILCEMLEKLPEELPHEKSVLIYHLASKFSKRISKKNLDIILGKIMSSKFDSTLRVEKAIEYFSQKIFSEGEEISKDKEVELENFCGVGVVVSPEQIEKEVGVALEQDKAELERLRYKYNVGKLMGRVREVLPWADGKAVRMEAELQIVTLLGPKTEEDLSVGGTKSNKAEPKIKKVELKVEKKEELKDEESIIEVMKKVNFHKPGENYKTEGYIATDNTKKLLEEHLKITGGQVRTRFPPEPNGILHIGHAKAININFGYAKAHNGICYLRYDDTNPEKEEAEFFHGILEMVEWLGYTPDKITHTSDYFDQLYLWAVELIKQGDAYVCHQTPDELKGFNPPPSPWRNRPIDENLQLFADMKNGKFPENFATLRLKLVLEEGKQDPVAYRIKYIPHHLTGTKWCIYPTYDYSHCLCDSIENITHSLCTKEFQSRRSTYYKLLNLLNLYCPVQFEYGRLNVDFTVMSKRKILKLLQDGHVKNWDDPRLFTLSALRRRGFTQGCINRFCAKLGVTGAQTSLDPSLLEFFARDELNKISKRIMVVLNPLKITIENYENLKNSLNFKDLIGNLNLRETIYIEQDDFNLNPKNNYRRLTLEQPVGLKHAQLILTCTRIIQEPELELICNISTLDSGIKPKSWIHWVSDPKIITCNLYETLFLHKNPDEVEGGYLKDLNENSLKIVNGFVDESLFGENLNIFDKFQFERLGYFCLDPDSKIADKVLVFNRTVSLKEDVGK